MNLKTNIPTTGSAQVETFDAVVIGAGFSGLYALHRLRDQMGLSARVFDIAGDGGAPGTGTATQVHVATLRAFTTPTLFLKNSSKSGRGASALPRSQKFCVI